MMRAKDGDIDMADDDNVESEVAKNEEYSRTTKWKMVDDDESKEVCLFD